MTMPQFSIVIATRNAARTLPRCLESLAGQTLRDFEVVLQDGASSDATLAAAENFRALLPALSVDSRADAGIYDAWNHALRRTAGEWILFLGADDQLAAPDVLERCAVQLQGCPATVLYAPGDVHLVFADGDIFETLPGRAEGTRARLPQELPFCHSALLHRRELFQNRCFDTGLRIVADYDFVCRTWTDDAMGRTLGFPVTRMGMAGLSGCPLGRLPLLWENARVAERYFPRVWTPRRVLRLTKAAVLYGLSAILGPRRGPIMLDLLRSARGLPPCWTRAAGLQSSTNLPFSRATVPTFVISYNRMDYLARLVDWLEHAGHGHIIIVDNASQYPPLLDYLAASPHRVVRLEHNLGHLVVWRCGLFDDLLQQGHYIVSDCDILPDEDCPPDAAEHFHAILTRYPRLAKAGFGLRLDDLPDHYGLKASVLAWEAKFWQRRMEIDEVYDAPIDTTFALYRPGTRPDVDNWWHSARTGPPYVARHLTWYEDTARPSAETIFYRQHIRTESTHWSNDDLNALKQENRDLQEEISRLRKEIEWLSCGWSQRLAVALLRSLRTLRSRLRN